MKGAQRTVIVVTMGLLSLAAVPAVTATDSTTEQLIQILNKQLLYIAVPIAILVEVILAYTVWRFRANGDRDTDGPQPTRENRQLEITWTIATALVLLFVGTASFYTLAHPAVSTILDDPQSSQGPSEVPEDAVEVNIIAEQWEYTFEYPDENVTATETLVLPVNQTVYLHITSKDVIHSVHVPELGLKQDAIPGQFNLLQTVPTDEGEYRLYCAELCGEGHAEMLSTVRVVSEDEYESWLDEKRSAATNESSMNESANRSDP